MRRKFFVAAALVLTLGATAAFSKDAVETTGSVENVEMLNVENQLTVEEFDLARERVEVIWNMDRSDLTIDSRHELKEELRKFKDLIQNQEPYIYIGGGTLLLIIILLIILL
ncbi:MAG: hypothetical protein EHM46_05700 [Bacteroidetes bacterium]|nr:MAG: hypothetical protein EHM46_05700 [Bacteroidota bacterium]